MTGKKNEVRITVRLTEEAAEALLAASHAARRPRAVLAREVLLAGLAGGASVPPQAQAKEVPPEPGEAGRHLIELLGRLVGNLTQMSAHADRLGPPLDRLAVEDGLLDRLARRARELGKNAKSGLLAEVLAVALSARLDEPARALNNRLARPLNEGSQLSFLTWREVLDPLQQALLADHQEAGQ